MVRTLAASLLAAAALLVLVGTAGAHTGSPALLSAPPPPAETTATVPVTPLRPGAPVPVTLPLFVAGTLVVVACASRRRLAVALVLLTAVVGVDAVIHSVHHLNDPAAAASCVLASGVSQAPAVLIDGTPVVIGPEASPERHAITGPSGAAIGGTRPGRGRAPPSSFLV
jgi:hypothetical protein